MADRRTADARLAAVEHALLHVQATVPGLLRDVQELRRELAEAPEEAEAALPVSGSDESSRATAPPLFPNSEGG